METKPAAPTPPHASSAAKTSGLQQRRQKNLQKFRRHKAAKREEASNSLGAKASAAPAPLEEKPEAKPVPKPAKVEKESLEVADADGSDRPKSPPPSKTECIQEQSPTMSPLAAPNAVNKRRVGIIKKLSKKNRPANFSPRGPASPISPNSSTSPKGQDSSCSVSTNGQHLSVSSAPLLSMTDSTDYKYKTEECNPQSNISLKMKPSMYKDDEALDSHCEPANENAQSKVLQQKLTSKPSEEALKPETNNNRLKRRTLHKKKIGKDIEKNREEKAVKGPAAGRTKKKSESEIETALCSEESSHEGKDSIKPNPNEPKTTEDAPVVTPEHQEALTKDLSNEDSPSASPESQGIPSAETTSNDDSPSVASESQGSAPILMTSSDDNPSVTSESKEPTADTKGDAGDQSVASESQEPPAIMARKDENPAFISEHQGSPPAETTSDDDIPSVAFESQEPRPRIQQESNQNIAPSQEDQRSDLTVNQCIPAGATQPGKEERSHGAESTMLTGKEPKLVAANVELVTDHAAVELQAEESAMCMEAEPMDQAAPEAMEDSEPQSVQATTEDPTQCTDSVFQSNELADKPAPEADKDSQKFEQGATKAPDSLNQADRNLNAASGSQDESHEVVGVEVGDTDSKKEKKKDTVEAAVKDELGLKVDIGGWDKVNADIDESKDTPRSEIMETSSSFDLRSIHEFPPGHIKHADAALPPQDPSWDTSKVFFTEFQQPASAESKNKSNAMNLFDPDDHECWATNDTISFAGFETSNNFFAGSSTSEEKKETDQLSLEFGMDFGKHDALPEPLGSPSSMVSPRRQLSRAQVNGNTNSFGFDVTNLAKDSTDELGNDDPTNVTGDAVLEELNENLLGEKEDTAEASDNGAWQIEASTPSKEERLQKYTANLDDCDNSSTTSLNMEEEDDSSHSSVEPPAVEYMFQVEEDNEDEDEKAASIKKEEAPNQIVDDALQLVLSAEAASAADVAPTSHEVAMEPSSLGDVSTPHDPAAVPNEAPAAHQLDPMTSISASDSEDNSNPVPLEQGAGNADGYISNSSSSDSAPSCTNDEDSHLQDHNSKQVEEEQEQNVAEDTSTGSNGSAEDEKDEDNEEDSTNLDPLDLEESPSLVGISLVPSFGQSGRTPSSVKPREGIPPRGSLSPSMVPPPPPPPPSKKRRKKGKSSSSRKGKKTFPLLSPPPEEKLKEWQASKNRALMHLGVVKESHMESDHQEFPKPSFDRPKVEDIVCGVFPDGGLLSPVESPGRIKLACGDFGDEGSWPAAIGTRTNSDIKCGAVAGDGTPRILDGEDPNICGLSGALAMAGLNTSPKPTQRHGGPTPSPVDAARSIALENAMRRASKGSSARFDFPGSSIRKEMETKSLFENELVTSNSMGSSRSMTEEETTPSLKHHSSHDTTVVEPPTVARRELLRTEHQRSVVFLQELTSPSLSMSPSNEGGGFPNASTQSSGMSPLIYDSKMAEKAALASYAAAVTFEEQYASSLLKDTNCQSVDSQDSEDRKDPVDDSDNPMSSLFCAPELEANIKRMAREDGKMHSFFLAAENLSKQDIDFAEIMEGKSGILKGLMKGVPTSPNRDRPDETQGLQRGAFTPFAMYTRKDDHSVSQTLSVPTTSTSKDSTDKVLSESASATESDRELVKVYNWLRARFLEVEIEPPKQSASDEVFRDEITRLLGDDENLNRLCVHLAEKMNAKIQLENEERAQRNGQLSPRKLMKPFQLSMRPSGQKSSSVVAANFVSFIHRVAKTSGVSSPFGEDNPFLLDLVGTSISNSGTPRSTCATPPPTPASIEISDGATMQNIVFSRCTADNIVKFCIEVCGGLDAYKDDIPLVPSVEVGTKTSGDSSFDLIEATRAANPSPTKKSRNPLFSQESVPAGERKFIVPTEHPSPFGSSVHQSPEILATILGILGDPVAVCRLKMMNRACRDYISQKEALLMRDAVRAGGLSMNLRPSFWLWVTLEKCGKNANSGSAADARKRLSGLEEKGRTGKWHNVIQRDVARSFGNMPPHKTGARLHTHSIVHALVTWGKNRIMKRGVKGGGDPPPYSCQPYGDPSDASQAPTDTVSDWGGVSPVASFTGSCGGPAEGEERRSRDSQSDEANLFVLSGNALSEEMKADLQGKLGFILHALAAKHEDVGYCQGMDYVVAHLLRILQDTVCWRAANDTLPASIHSATNTDSSCQNEVDKTFVVEDAVFQVMDRLFTTYNLQHMYWPELRCLKTCCKVFERLIQLKLPVLADHFEHHELNVGLFALGWFQTLFLYLPSMPSATVCHMWDIWLVERSFKIFFRVGTAILFLSQPTLLNHELEGMQIYLNTFPDATLLNPDILIACALQIKVTNKMLMDIEDEVCGTGE